MTADAEVTPRTGWGSKGTKYCLQMLLEGHVVHNKGAGRGISFRTASCMLAKTVVFSPKDFLSTSRLVELGNESDVSKMSLNGGI